MTVDRKGDHWTYGAEHELSDWDCLRPLPEGFARSPDHTIVNSNGIATQPNIKVYSYGGEFNTPPSNTLQEQGTYLRHLLASYQCAINHRSNLHLHIRVPGLRDDLKALKQVQQYIHTQLPTILLQLEPIPPGTTSAERKRARRRQVSHHTFLSTQRLTRQLAASTPQEFYEREVPRSSQGVIMWHAQPRCCVNLRQLLQTETVEFRHFPGTLSPNELVTCGEWCRDFMHAALDEIPLREVWHLYQARQFPTFPEFEEELEIGYQATASNIGLSRAEVLQNISLIQEGTFYASPAYERAWAITRGVKEGSGRVPR